jgi:hypothetical protein
MGFLIFALRKLQLKRQKSQLEYRLTVLGSKVEQIQKAEAQFQQSISSAKNMINIFQQAQSMSNQMSMFGMYDKNADGSAQTDQVQYMKDFMAQQQSQAMASNFVNSIFDNMSQSRLSVLKAQEDQITQEKTSEESQLKYISEELQGVEKSEDAAAKEDAPHFGQS